MKILLAHPGTQHSYKLAEELFALKSLYKFLTSLSFGKGGWMNFLLPKSWDHRRSIAVPCDQLGLQPWLEFFSILIKLGFDSAKIYSIRNQIFQHAIANRHSANADAVIGFDTSSLVLARRAKKYGVKFFLELTTPHPGEKQLIQQSLMGRFPIWMENERKKNGNEFFKEDEEVREAFHVIAPSQYVKETYVNRGHPGNKISVNPYGASLDAFSIKSYKKKTKLKFLFLGSLTANKGVPILLDAWQKLNTDAAELVLAGYGKIPGEVITLKGVLQMGRVEKNDRLALFHSADVFLCPSFYEGLALVQLEAAACGLPVIGTTTSGLLEFTREGIGGFAVEAGAVDQLVQKMKFFIENPEQVEAMGKEAHQQAQKFTWAAYAQRWIDIIDGFSRL